MPPVTRSIVWKGSPNFGYPRGTHGQLGRHTWGKVYHISGGGTLNGMGSWFNNPAASASAHFGIDGRIIHQYVKLSNAAWHAGGVASPDLSNSIIRKLTRDNLNPNRYLVGIEVVASPGDVLSKSTWDSLIWLSDYIDQELGLGDQPDVHLGHNQINSVSRARDPVSVYDPRKVWREHHMAELTQAQKEAIIKGMLLGGLVDIEAITTRFDLRDTLLF
ncbi:hypothetical protein LCGC14_3102110, partial [marine sediment metagenome]